MKTIKIKNGTVKYPDNWVAIKNKEPLDCEYCGILSVRNNARFNIPTYLFFLDKPVNQITKEDEKDIIEICCIKNPNFKLIVNSQVTPQYDENHKLLNAKEWNSAPTIGFFHIFNHDDDYGLFNEAFIYRS